MPCCFSLASSRTPRNFSPSRFSLLSTAANSFADALSRSARMKLPCTMRSIICSIRRNGLSSQLLAKAVISRETSSALNDTTATHSTCGSRAARSSTLEVIT